MSTYKKKSCRCRPTLELCLEVKVVQLVHHFPAGKVQQPRSISHLSVSLAKQGAESRFRESITQPVLNIVEIRDFGNLVAPSVHDSLSAATISI